MNQMSHLIELTNDGYAILSNIYSEAEIKNISKCITKKKLEGKSILKTNDLFAVRQLLFEIPGLSKLIFNKKLNSLIQGLHTKDKLFLTKAIYFDKPEGSNWFVAFHQDLTINVTKKVEVEGFKNWTNKKGQLGVQPPIEYLERTITIRIHLDDTDEANGALHVIKSSHTNGIQRMDGQKVRGQKNICNVSKGGVMLMKPLTLHASNRSTGNKNRRVIHLEFCDKELPKPLRWKERFF